MACRSRPTGSDPQRRNDILVQGRRGAEPEGPKSTAPLVNTPRSIVVLPREVIEDSGSSTLAEALRTVPGITFGAAEGRQSDRRSPFYSRLRYAGIDLCRWRPRLFGTKP